MQTWQNNYGAIRIVSALFDNTIVDIDLDSNTRVLTGIQVRSLAKMEPSRAESWLIKAEDGPDMLLTSFALCEHYLENGRHDEAVASCQSGGVPGQIWLNKGLDELSRDNPQGAIKYFEFSVLTDPTLPDGYYFLGREFYKQKAYTEAIPILEAVIRLDQNVDASIYAQLGQSYLKTEDMNTAQVILNDGISRFPEDQTLYLLLADAYEASGDFDLADEWYGRLLQKWPDNGRGWSQRGELAFKQGKWSEAAVYLQTAVRFQSDSLGNWSRLAHTAVNNGDSQLASQAYDRSLQLDPTNINLWLSAGKFYANEAQVERARQIYEHILEVAPDNEEAEVQLEKLNEE